MKDAHFAKDLQGRLDDEAQDIDFAECVQLEIFEEDLAAGGDDELGPDDIHLVDQDAGAAVEGVQVRVLLASVQKLRMMDY